MYQRLGNPCVCGRDVVRKEITMRDIFKIATKKKYRFNYKGSIGVEELWDLSPEELDRIYAGLKREQKKSDDESLLKTATKEDTALADRIEIVKTIVNDKLAARERAVKAAERKAQNQRILEIMADKQDAALKEKSIEELQAMLATAEAEEEE